MSATIFITGNVTKEPRVVKIGDTQAVTFDVGVNTDKKQADGTWMANYYQCLLYGKPGETFMKLVQKGTNISFHGSFRMESWEKDGKSGTVGKIIVEGKVDYNKNLKNADGSSTVRSSNNKPDYSKARANNNYNDSNDSDSPW